MNPTLIILSFFLGAILGFFLGGMAFIYSPAIVDLIIRLGENKEQKAERLAWESEHSDFMKTTANLEAWKTKQRTP